VDLTAKKVAVGYGTEKVSIEKIQDKIADAGDD
jgi:copper chaperone CopZ